MAAGVRDVTARCHASHILFKWLMALNCQTTASVAAQTIVML